MKELLEKLFQELGLFVDFKSHTEPEQEVKKGEKILEEMNVLEKNCFTFLSEKEKEHEKLKEAIMLLGDKKGKKQEIAKLEHQHLKLHKAMEVARCILWASIENRIQSSEGSTGIGVRKGFKIIESFEDEPPSISGMVIPGLGMVISVGRG